MASAEGTMPASDTVTMDLRSQVDTQDEAPRSDKGTAQTTEAQVRTDEPAVLSAGKTDETRNDLTKIPLFEKAPGERTQLTGVATAPASSAAGSLPVEILHKILYSVDSETFASTTLVNRNWRSATDNAKLYAHHLSRSPLYSRQNPVITASIDDAKLPGLKRSFAQEAKRCLYTPFLRPKITIVNLISETPLSSFAAGPGGEKFDFTFSHYGRWCLAISSSRIYIVDLEAKNQPSAPGTDDSAAEEQTDIAPSADASIPEKAKGKEAERITSTSIPSESIIRVTKELKVVRRPLGADILADGSVLAVLSSDHQVSLYNVIEDKVELRRSVDLDNPPYAISMSPGGEILAAAFDGGMELCSLRQGASPGERRTVKCHRVDKLMFSSDGSMLLGTTSTKDPATVILSAPYFNAMEHDLTQAELVNSMWTQQILFPSSSRDCSHSTLLPRYGDDNSNWTLTYDRTYESFRAVRTDDLRNGTTYFTGPQGTDRRVLWPKDALVPSSLPSATAKGDLVAAGFKGSEIWLYGVPENLDANASTTGQPEPSSATSDGPGDTTDENAGAESGETEGERPRWQMLVDKYRNVFSKGKKVADVSGIAAMCWYKQAESQDAPSVVKLSERLIVAAPGGVGSDFILDEETPIEGGRLVVLDFSLEPHDGTTEEITIELGKKEPLLLEEQKTDMEAEIAKARRRTMAHRDAARVRSVIDALRPNNGLEDIPDVPEVPGSFGFNTDAPRGTGDHPDVSDDDEPGVSVEEAAAFAEGPYSHTNPRSRAALYRSATVSAASRQRLPNLPRHQEQVPQPVFRRTDGTEVPDESDADNWVMPPPPYQRYVEEQLPDDLVQRALLYNGIAPIPNTFETLVRPRRSSSVNTDTRSHRRRSSVDTDVLAYHLRPARTGEEPYRAGDTTAVSSANVTPRSSIRRRPLTTYSSGSVALRESNLALRDSNIARPVSHLTRSSSLSSANIRLSRSESLRRTSQAGSNLALSPPQPNLHEQANWPLPAPQEQPEPVSPPEEADDPLETAASVAPQMPATSSGASVDEARAGDLSPPSPASETPVSPEEKIINMPPPDDEEPISPRAVAPVEQPVVPWIDTPPQRDPSPAQQASAAPDASVQQPESEPEPVTTRSRQDSATISPLTRAPIEALSIAPIDAPSQRQEYFPTSPPSPEQPRQTPAQPVQAQRNSTLIQTIPRKPPPQDVSRIATSPVSPEDVPSASVSQTTQRQSYSQPFPAQPISQPPPQNPATYTQTEPAPEASIPEPSAFQLSNLQTRPRPQAHQLSGGHRPAITVPSPTPYSSAQSYTAYSPARAASSMSHHQELASDAASVKSRKRRNRLSQRIRGAFRRNEDEEPMPELPIVPQLPGLVSSAQPSPVSQGPARHSRMYADNRNNASEPALNRRPPAQRLDTIQSVGSNLARIPSVRHAQTPEPATPMHMPVVPEAVPRESRRPSTKRSRSIFGGRRRSQVGGAVVQNEEMPPVPPMPSSVADAYGPGARSDSVPYPGSINRAATAEPLGYFPGQAVHTEISGGKKKKSKDKDAKCLVM